MRPRRGLPDARASAPTAHRWKGFNRMSLRLRDRHDPSLAGAPHVVIIGGGFGGLHAARAFKGQHVRVTLIDRRNHHVFQPLLYQVATAALSPADIASPIRAILRKLENVR